MGRCVCVCNHGVQKQVESKGGVRGYLGHIVHHNKVCISHAHVKTVYLYHLYGLYAYTTMHTPYPPSKPTTSTTPADTPNKRASLISPSICSTSSSSLNTGTCCTPLNTCSVTAPLSGNCSRICNKLRRLSLATVTARSVPTRQAASRPLESSSTTISRIKPPSGLRRRARASPRAVAEEGGGMSVFVEGVWVLGCM